MESKLKISLTDLLLIIVEFLVFNILIFLYGNHINSSIVLPVVYIMGQIILTVLLPKWKKNPVVLIFMGGFLVKLYAYPIVTVLFGFGSYAFFDLNDNLFKAVLLQIYEYSSLLLVTVWYFKRKKSRYETGSPVSVLNRERFFTRFYRNLIIIFGLISFVILIRYESLLSRFRLIYFSSQDQTDSWYASLGNIGSVPLLISEFGFWLIELEKILIVYLIITTIKHKINFLPEYVKIALSFLAISTVILITTNDRAGSFIAGIVMLFLLIRLYPEKRKALVKLFGIGIVVFAVFIIVVFPMRDYKYSVQYGSSSDMTYISKKINAYFGGVVNVSCALSMPRTDTSKYIKGDILGYIPMIKYFNDSEMSYELFNSTLNIGGVGGTSQITPAIGQSYFYFGFLFAPILQILTYIFALHSQNKANKSNNTYAYFVYQYIALFSSAGLTLYYFSLTAMLLMQYCLPLFVMLKIFMRRKKSSYEASSVICKS